MHSTVRAPTACGRTARGLPTMTNMAEVVGPRQLLHLLNGLCMVLAGVAALTSVL